MKRISIIITAINFATHGMPFVTIFPLLFLTTIFSNELEIEWLGTILTFLFLISIVIYVIGVFLAPLIQFILMIVAMIRKKWWLVGVHIVSAILLSGGIVLFIMVAGPIYNIIIQNRCTQKVRAQYVTCKTNEHIGTILPVTYTPCFEYNWDGKEYQVMPIDGELSKKKITEFHSDQQYDLYIDKRKPERASLRRGISHVGIIELVFGFGCYGVIWITMFLLFIEMIES